MALMRLMTKFGAAYGYFARNQLPPPSHMDGHWWHGLARYPPSTGPRTEAAWKTVWFQANARAGMALGA